MDTTELTTTAPAADAAPVAETKKPARVAKPKRALKMPATQTKSKVAAPTGEKPQKRAKAEGEEKAEAPRVNVHREAGVDVTRYNGLSSFLNMNRKVAVRQGIDRKLEEVTGRQRALLYAARDVYQGRAFPAKGLDNGILGALQGAGLITITGETVRKDGHDYIVEGAAPAMVKITAIGLKFGKVPATANA